jgi:hypothetical protein
MYPWKPFSTREENPSKSFDIFFKRNDFTTKKDLAHKRVLKPYNSRAQERCAPFSKEVYLLKFPNSQVGYVSTMGNFPLLILDLSYQLKCLLAQ